MNADDVLLVDRYGDGSSKRILCRLCSQVLYDHAAGEPIHPDYVYVSVGAHLEFSHSIAVEIRACNDPACWKKHG